MKKILASPYALTALLVRWIWIIGALLGGFSGLVHAVEVTRAEILVQSGHGGSAMEDARFVDTDRYLISAGRDGKAVLWDAISMREIRAVAMHRFKITALGTTPHSDVIATGDVEGYVCITKVRAPICTSPRRVSEDSIHVIEISSSGKLVVAADGAGQLRAFEHPAGRLRWSVNTGHREASVRAISIGPHGQPIRTYGWDGVTKVWDADNGRLLHTSTVRDGSAAATSADGQNSVFQDGFETITAAIARRPKRTIPIRDATDRLGELAVSPDGDAIAYYVLDADAPHTVELVSGPDFSSMKRLPTFPTLVQSIRFSANGDRIVITQESQAIVYRTSDQKPLGILSGVGSVVNHLAQSEDGRITYVSSDRIGVWSTETGVRTQVLPIKDADQIVLVPGRPWIASVSRRGVEVNDISSGAPIWRWAYCSRCDDPAASSKEKAPGLIGMLATDLVASADGQHLAARDWDGNVRVWDVVSGHTRIAFRTEEDTYGPLEFTADSTQLLVGSGRTLQTWSITDGSQPTRTWQAKRSIRGIVTVNGSSVVVVSVDGLAYQLDATSAELAPARRVTDQPVQRIRVSLDHKLMALVHDTKDGQSARVRVLNLPEFTLIGDLTITGTSVYDVVFHARKDLLTVALADGSIRTLSISTNAEIVRSLGGGEQWLTSTDEGYFVATPEVTKIGMSVRKGNNAYSMDQLWDAFYRPDIVKRKLAGQDVAPYLDGVTADLALTQRPPQRIELKVQPVQADRSLFRVSYSVTAESGGIGALQLLHNGKVISTVGQTERSIKRLVPVATNAIVSTPTTDSRFIGIEIDAHAAARPKAEPPLATKTGSVISGTLDIRGLPGASNEVSMVAFNRDRTMRSMPSTVTFSVDGPAEPPQVFLLAVGIDIYAEARSIAPLKNAANDATDVLQALRKVTGGSTRNVSQQDQLLLNEAATKARILESLRSIRATARPQDMLVVFVASHGLLDAAGDYGFIPHDWTPNDRGSVFTQTELLRELVAIPALQQLLILDTCHAGGLNREVEAIYDVRLQSLARNSGLHILAGATSAQLAIDGSGTRNGLFTGALLDEVGRNPDASIRTMGEQAAILTRKRAEMRGRRQEPVMWSWGRDWSLQPSSALPLRQENL